MMSLWSSFVTHTDLYQGHKSSGEERCHLSLLGGYYCSSGRHHHCPLYMMMILNSVIWTLVIGYIHACNGGEPLTELLYWPQSQAIQLSLHKTGREFVLLSLATMAEGEATPVVEAKRLVEREEEGMSQSYHEIFDTQVSLCTSGTW